MTIISTQNQCMEISCYCICYIWPLATNSWLVQTYCLLAFSCSGAKKEACVLEGNLNNVMLSKGNLEQTINCIPDAQTLNWGSDFIKGPGFLNVGKTPNRETLNRGTLCIT
jgi:hypothetical protein